MNKEIINKLSSIITDGRVSENEQMSVCTTFRTGGAADIFADISNVCELMGAVRVLKNEPFYMIGNGSNLLVSDSGIRGVVLRLAGTFDEIRVIGTAVYCGASATLAQVAKAAYESSLSGLEFASGIPGSLGGAIVMNAGAYDGEMKNVVKSVALMDYAGNITEKNADEMRFSYRSSIIKEEKFIVLSAVLELGRGDKRKIKEKMDDFAARRRDKQPLEYPSAGSTFKRPEGHFAAKLIEDAGLKGFSIGGAKVSEKHAGFVINTGNATSADIYALIKEIQRRVKETAGVELETEVICLGDF